MPKISYVPRKFSDDSRALIDQANAIFSEYAGKGFVLTLRQLYYQFVARGVLANKQESYKRLGSIINDARLAGLVDWDHMEDRTRNLQELSTWNSPQSVIDACADQFRIDKWAEQEYHVEVWIEKDALAGVFEGVCNRLQVAYFSCRGYTSQSEMWVAGRRLRRSIMDGKTPVILHFGDHDPSGMDMTRDITERLALFAGQEVLVKRLALTMDQIEEFTPPPNPAKTTDSRAVWYIETYGDESWELDALSPEVLAGLVEDAVGMLRTEDLWDKAVEEEDEHKRLLGEVAKKWTAITRDL